MRLLLPPFSVPLYTTQQKQNKQPPNMLSLLHDSRLFISSAHLLVTVLALQVAYLFRVIPQR